MPGRTQGNAANSSGNVLEQAVISTMTAKDFALVSYSKWAKHPGAYGGELLLKNVPYDTIYGHSGKTEFLLKSAARGLEIRIECKWQQAAGSVDEKFPYLYLNCIEAMPENHIIILVDGGGYKQGAIKWLNTAVNRRRYQSQNNGKTIQVMKLVEFIRWANKNF
ncbi:PD-(D/E)XK nuclease superfamily protein [Campylobacter concisus]|jgi:4-diphosphocytidyl-2-methyl-D-erithritol synthase|uniref:PD-(D/E)XK nuclease superfamily protein n=1 Tax=Campylobacter concisus TaxID=199 RepID=UPI000CD8F166|nr:PD-(D/E)XK nuclease superfamily protein [Campylobacter concisus]